MIPGRAGSLRPATELPAWSAPNHAVTEFRWVQNRRILPVAQRFSSCPHSALQRATYRARLSRDVGSLARKVQRVVHRPGKRFARTLAARRQVAIGAVAV